VNGLVVAAFLFTYAGMALGRLPGLRVDRTGIALIAVAILLAGGAIDTGFLARAIDAPTLVLLFALMVVSAQFANSGFYAACADRIVRSVLPPRRLLAMTVAIAGGLSAVLVNDIVVFALAPLLVEGLRRRGLDPRPFLLGMAAASNAGSAATVIGNPQNILLGQLGDLGFWGFVGVCGLPALVSLGVVYAIVAYLWRAELIEGVAAPPAAPPVVERWQVTKAFLATGAVLALLSTPLPREAGVLAVSAVLLASRRMSSRGMLTAVDWPLLLLFACLFTVTAAMADTGLAAGALAWLEDAGYAPTRLTVIAPMALVASNTIGNVPAVVLLTTLWPELSPGALYALALLSTLAGNFLIVGSIANLIVAERAEAVGVRLTFADFARAGMPITLVTMTGAVVWLAATGQLPW
jgi:Na+/H+ antiporter NhaD/arsenite permease-like protein